MDLNGFSKTDWDQFKLKEFAKTKPTFREKLSRFSKTDLNQLKLEKFDKN